MSVEGKYNSNNTAVKRIMKVSLLFTSCITTTAEPSFRIQRIPLNENMKS